MPKVAVLFADGFEEVEAMAIVDVLRRAEVETVMTGLHAGPVTSARKVNVLVDAVIDSVNPDDFDMIILPGGQPGSDNLNKDGRVRDLIRKFVQKGKLTGAICAAPIVLAGAGVLDGRHATSYPVYRDKLGRALYQEDAVVIDGNIMTSRGPGTALGFALAVAERLVGKERAEKIRGAMLVPPV